MTTYWPDFCGSETEYDAFWSSNITLDTHHPDLTRCFQNTVLIWAVCGSLWIMTPLYIPYVKQFPKTHQWCEWSIFNFVKTVVACLLTLVSLLDIMLSLAMSSDTPADPIAKILLFMTFALATLLTRWVYTRGFHTSGVLFTFWMLAFFNNIIVLRSKAMSGADGVLFVTCCIQLALVAFQFVASFFADIQALGTSSVLDSAKEDTALLDQHWKEQTRVKTKPCPKETATFLSTVFFTWMTPKLFKGVKHPIQGKDIWDIMDDFQTRRCYNLLNECWGKQMAKRPTKAPQNSHKKVTWSSTSIPDEVFLDSCQDSKKGLLLDDLASASANKKIDHSMPGPSLAKALKAYIGPYFLIGAVFMGIYGSLAIASTQVLQIIIQYIESGDPYAWKGYACALLLAVVAQFATLGMEHFNNFCWQSSLRTRGALVSAICRKVLRLSSTGRQDLSVGGVVSMVSVDMLTLHRMFLQAHYVWISPFFTGVGIMFVWQQIGWASLTGMLLLILVLPVVSAVVAHFMANLQRKQMELKDRRMKLTNQMMNGMKVLKLYAWEPYFEKEVKDLREKEVKILRKITVLSTLTFTLWFSCSFLVAVVSFLTYTLSSPSNVLDAKKVFVSISLFSGMNMPLAITAQSISTLVQASVSIKRIQAFLLRDELDDDGAQPLTYDPSTAIHIKDGDFCWGSRDPNCLENINVKIDRGSLVAVVGAVGSGKSSLMHAILGEIMRKRGSATTRGSMAYVPQQAWIQNMTVKDNILFGSLMNKTKYDNVLQTCALLQDLEILAAGDMTEIGERGINLSGGQKQRVSLARAAYSDADIYLLDDPLSAVDSHVGAHLFQKLIGPEGMLKGKTRVLVTHGIRYLPVVDNIIVMKDGTISEMGSYEDLVKSNGEFAEFLRNYSNGMSETNHTPDEEDTVQSLEFSDQTVNIRDEALSLSVGSFESPLGIFWKRRRSRKKKKAHNTENKAGELIEEEFVDVGHIKPAIIHSYLKGAGWVFCLLFAIFALGFVLMQCLNQLWLSEWSRDKAVNGTMDRDLTFRRVGVYAGLSTLQIMSVSGMVLAFALGAMMAAIHLHSDLLHSVLRSPMSFFDTTPVGRLVNRFSKDMNAIDVDIPILGQQLLTVSFTLLSQIILVLYILPITGFVIFPLMAVFVVLQRIYTKSASQLQRVDTTRRSPIYALIGELLVGSTSIRAFGQEDRFIERAEQLVDSSQCSWYELMQANRWIGTCVEIIGNMSLFATAVFGIMQKDNMDSSSLAMAISFSMQITLCLLVAVRAGTDLELQLICLERVVEFTELPSEAEWEIKDSSPSIEWPDEGSVTFQNYQSRYRPGLDLVLRGVSCCIKPMEKVGIVGRTGAGKSSLTLSLFRLIEATGGSIEIDGIDISKIGLHDVRGRLTIIPQDPVIFSGTLRFNVDPSRQHTDSEILAAFGMAHMKTYVQGLPEGLDFDCGDEGHSLSVGQRQLVCLARALLRKSKILVLDEATAAVDLETDDRIQETVRTEFKDSTVITIAHRLNTIIDYDRVIVMDNGSVREFDSPDNLLSKPESLFHLMAKDAGLV